jgi:hypothetical protein
VVGSGKRRTRTSCHACGFHNGLAMAGLMTAPGLLLSPTSGSGAQDRDVACVVVGARQAYWAVAESYSSNDLECQDFLLADNDVA